MPGRKRTDTARIYDGTGRLLGELEHTSVEHSDGVWRPEAIELTIPVTVAGQVRRLSVSGHEVNYSIDDGAPVIAGDTFQILVCFPPV